MPEYMNQKCKVAVVMLSYNSCELLKTVVPVLLKNTALNNEVQFIIADNASTDNSVEYIERHHPEVQLVTYNTNSGFAGGFNKILNQVQADYYIAISCDVEVDENWLTPMIELMDSSPDVAACQPMIMSSRQRLYFEHAGAAGDYIDTLGFPFCRGRVVFHNELNNGQYNTVQEIFWTGGCCVMFRATAFHEAGGFDEDFFAHMEEIDLSWRMQRLGYRLLVSPDSTVFHYGGYTLDYNNPRKLYLNYRNNLAMLTKNWTKLELCTKLPLRFLIDFSAAFYFLFTKGPRHFVSVLRAQIDYLLRLSSILKKRRAFNPADKGNRIKGVYKKSILVDYYFFRNRKFSKLRW